MIDQLKNLVVVEDDPDMRLLIQAALEVDERLKITGEAISAEQAIQLASSMDLSLIVLDHSIEGSITGLEAAPLLKEAAPSAKILLFTAYDMEREAKAEPAVDAYLRKDDFPRLLSTVRALVGLTA